MQHATHRPRPPVTATQAARRVFLLGAFALASFACDRDEPGPNDPALAESGEVGERSDSDRAERAREKFAMLDADGSGTLSRAEVEGHKFAHKFDEVDTNGDGNLTPAEVKAFFAEHRGEHRGKRHGGGHGKGGKGGKGHDVAAKFAKLDADGSGSLSKAEVEGHRFADRFDTIDANSDGQITTDELRAHWEQHMDEHGGKGGTHHDPAEKLAKLDANGDGALSRDEVAGHKLADRFDEVDADGDGAVSLDELKAHKQAHHGEHGKGHHGGKHGRGHHSGTHEKGADHRPAGE